MRRIWGIALLVVTFVGVGCSGADNDDDSSTAGAAESATAASGAGNGAGVHAAADGDSTAQRSAAGAGGSVAQGETLPDTSTKVVRTADLRIEVEKGAFSQRLREASALARALGGFVQSSSTSSFEEGDASGEVMLRVPVDRFDDAMTRLMKLGTVESSAEEGEDVTGQLVDLGARVRALRAEEDALNALMADAANVNEVLAIRSTAVGIRQQIEQLAAQEASLAERSTFSTIHVVLHEASASLDATNDDWSIAQAIETAGDVAVRIVGAMIVAIGVGVPLLPFALLALYLARRRRLAVPTEG